MYTRFAKVFYFITVVFFIVGFLYIYASLPEKVTYELSGDGSAGKELGRDTFFFVAMATFVVLNLMIVVPAKMVESNFSLRLRRILHAGDPFRDQMLSWVYSFAGIFNINLIILDLYVSRINSFVGNESGWFNFIYYLGPVLLLLWILALFFLLGKRIKQIQS